MSAIRVEKFTLGSYTFSSGDRYTKLLFYSTDGVLSFSDKHMFISAQAYSICKEDWFRMCETERPTAVYTDFHTNEEVKILSLDSEDSGRTGVITSLDPHSEKFNRPMIKLKYSGIYGTSEILLNIHQIAKLGELKPIKFALNAELEKWFNS